MLQSLSNFSETLHRNIRQPSQAVVLKGTKNIERLRAQNSLVHHRSRLGLRATLKIVPVSGLTKQWLGVKFLGVFHEVILRAQSLKYSVENQAAFRKPMHSIKDASISDSL